MNRDERRDRVPAKRPRRWAGEAGGFTAPVDPDGGGTWIAGRADGLVLALLNHQPGRGVRLPPADRRISRGRLVTLLAAEAGVPGAVRLRAEGLDAFAPFRLFVAAPDVAPRVYTWNGARLIARRLDPRLGFLTSSSWNPSRVIPARHAAFRGFLRAHPRPTRADLEGLHAQATAPRGTPWAICMARDDARTVSTTVVEVAPGGAVRMTYAAR